jgi:hypothetical protein
LSLIYQISGGMKVNRGAADFFRQACHDVLEVMNVRGMGRRPSATSSSTARPPRSTAQIGACRRATSVERLHEQLMVTMRERKSSLLVRDLRLSARVRLPRALRPADDRRAAPAAGGSARRVVRARQVRRRGVRLRRLQAAQLDRQRVGDLPRNARLFETCTA